MATLMSIRTWTWQSRLVLSIVAFTSLGRATPLSRGLASPGSIDPSADAWAEALSGIGPLILLIGERNTKQLLRDMSGLHSILSLAFAPIGLLSVLTSMIRICGAHSLQSFLGYQYEARTVAALEVTRVNCGNIHAELVDGSIVRSTAPNPPSQALAAVLLRGNSETVVMDAIRQVRNCEDLQARLRLKNCPQGAVDMRWCFRITATIPDEDSARIVLSVIAQALDISEDSFPLSGVSTPTEKPKSTQRPKARRNSSGWSLYSTLTGSTLLSRKSTSTKASNNKPPLVLPRPLNVTFLCTFNALSEFSVGPTTPRLRSLLIAICSLVAMLAVQMMSFWNRGWTSSAPIMVIAGYIGLFSGVSAAAWLIYDSQDSETLKLQQQYHGSGWKSGVIDAIKKPDSMDTSGTRLQQNRSMALSLEAAWLKYPTKKRLMFTWFVSVFTTFAFVCHYLGLRSSKWWLAVTELFICLIAAFARAMIKTEPSRDKFIEDDEIHVDKRCYSTGILDSTRPMRIKESERNNHGLDLRIYSLQKTQCTPAKGENIAWCIAKLLLQRPRVAEFVLNLTGMNLTVCRGDCETERKVIAAYDGGILTDEGLAYPNAQMCVAFPTAISDLAAPTPLLVRGIMRQCEWTVLHTFMEKKNLPWFGGMYITTLDSLLSWWILSEDRNDMTDQHSNLHGSMILISTAFFLAVLRSYSDDVGLVTAIEALHKPSREEEDVAESFSSFLVEHMD